MNLRVRIYYTTTICNLCHFSSEAELIELYLNSITQRPRRQKHKLVSKNETGDRTSFVSTVQRFATTECRYEGGDGW